VYTDLFLDGERRSPSVVWVLERLSKGCFPPGEHALQPPQESDTRTILGQGQVRRGDSRRDAVSRQVSSISAMSPPAAVESRLSLGALLTRIALLLSGSLIVTTCYALTVRADLGLGPLFVLQDGVARHAGIAIGTAVTVIGFALVFVALALRFMPGPGTLVLPILAGVTLNVLLTHVPTLHGLLLRTACVLVASWLMALGGAMIIRASVGVAAYDAVMLGLRRVTGRPLAPIRLAMEATVLTGGWLLDGSVGVGTAITGLLIGPGIQFWLHVIGDPTITPILEARLEAVSTLG